ncbi:zinc finger protein 226-like [Scaptodrosophila lebanonensis]|uniref:Zinc finger protein 226-like n=1 Tax=Drosophila lebanonensis TaxID=7225 RepID=A0A6J2TUD0_DROLE|nr:zinc finger protein 226-like [Scaptodrosophila lebanonensis]
MGHTILLNMEHLCRVCLSNDVTLVRIFTEPDTELVEAVEEELEVAPSLAEMMSECVDCEVRREDALPQHICLGCELATRNAFRFKRQCEQSYRRLCQLLSRKESLQQQQDKEEDEGKENSSYSKKKPTAEAKQTAEEAEEEEEEGEQCSESSEAICDMPIEPAAYEELEMETRLVPNNELDVNNLKVEIKTEEQTNGFIEVLLCDKINQKEGAESKSCGRQKGGRSKLVHHCDICERQFSSRLYLIRHQGLHGRKRYACKACSTSYGTRDELTAHIKDKGHDKPMLCPECGLRCKTSHTLMVHMRRHNGEKPFKCKFCSKGFPRMDDLRVHEKYHTGEKAHFCETCGKGFLRKYNLTIHTRVHTGERPYKCPHCPQAFAQGNDLKAHIRRHTGERFRCEYCPAGFLQHYKIRQHKLLHHGIKEEAPTQRVAKFRSVEEQQQQIARNMQSKDDDISENEQSPPV